jgi:crotonobetainyl-CoA:carnitine CoA-transferase CaiB-like acyl-CoA transferase
MLLHTFLAGTRVLDLSQYLPGPFATRMLADLGADVLKVEPPAGDPLRHIDPSGGRGRSPFYDLINAGKTVTFLDLKVYDDAAVMARLVQEADVLLESYRPGVLDRLGFGADRLADLNPRLIHCALSGFGQTGPDRLTSGHDIGYVAMTGTLSACGHEHGPVIPYPPLADHAGAYQAVISILGALIARGRSGHGCTLDVSLMESLLALQGPPLTLPPGLGAGIINGGAAFYNLYRTHDGRFVTLSPIEPKFWANFCRAVGRDDWLTRQHEPLPQHALIDEIQAMFATRPLADWETLLGPADCCYQAVLDYREVPDHPQIKARRLLQHGAAFLGALVPALLDGRPPQPRRPVREIAARDARDAWAGQGVAGQGAAGQGAAPLAG